MKLNSRERKILEEKVTPLNKKELLEGTLCCLRCGTCRGVTQDMVPDTSFSTQCPCGMTFYGAYEPAGLIYIARGIAQGTLKWSEDLTKGTVCLYPVWLLR